MKKFAIMAILAMFCMAGIVSAADVTVSGSVSTKVVLDTPSAGVSMNLVAGSTATKDVVITGSANCAYTITPSTLGMSIDGNGVDYLDTAMGISPNPASGTAPMGTLSKTFTLTQPVLYADTVGSYSGLITFTAAAA